MNLKLPIVFLVGCIISVTCFPAVVEDAIDKAPSYPTEAPAYPLQQPSLPQPDYAVVSTDIVYSTAPPPSPSPVYSPPADEVTVPYQPTDVVAAPYQPTEVVTAPYQPTEVVAAPYQPTEVVATPYQPTEVVTAPYQPTEVVAAPYQPTEVVAAPYQPTEVVAAPYQPTEVVAAPYQPTDVVAAPYPSSQTSDKLQSYSPTPSSYSAGSNPEIKDVEVRTHSVHASFKKENPYEYEQPIEPVEVEEFDPYNDNAPFSNDDTNTATSYTSEEEEVFDPVPILGEKKEGNFDLEQTIPLPNPANNYYEEEGFGVSSESEYYTTSKPESYNEEEEEQYVEQIPTPTTEQPLTTFLQGFDQILVAADNYRNSLTPALRVLIEDASGRKGVVTCKLQRTRLVVTKGVNTLLESYPHWIKLGTTIEESHCKQDSKLALLAFSTEVDKVSKDLAGMEDMDLDDELEDPNAAFKRLEQAVVKTLLLFPSNLDVHESHNEHKHGSHLH